MLAPRRTVISTGESYSDQDVPLPNAGISLIDKQTNLKSSAESVPPFRTVPTRGGTG